MGRWNFDTTLFIECEIKDDGMIHVVDLNEDEDRCFGEFSKEIIKFAGKTSTDTLVEAELCLECEGYFCPGKYTGPPEDCYPDDGEDHRTITRVIFHFDNEIQVPTEDKKFLALIADLVEDEIYNKDIEDMKDDF